MPGPAWRDYLRALGAPEDPVATDVSSNWSIISLWKGIFQAISDGSFAAGIVGRAESIVALSQSAASQVSTSARVAKSSKVLAQAAATAASSDATIAQLAAQAGSFAAGTALFGQRAKKDRLLAAASATAAAASAASVPTVEQSVLGIQVYS